MSQADVEGSASMLLTQLHHVTEQEVHHHNEEEMRQASLKMEHLLHDMHDHMHHVESGEDRAERERREKEEKKQKAAAKREAAMAAKKKLEESNRWNGGGGLDTNGGAAQTPAASAQTKLLSQSQTTTKAGAMTTAGQLSHRLLKGATFAVRAGQIKKMLPPAPLPEPEPEPKSSQALLPGASDHAASAHRNLLAQLNVLSDCLTAERLHRDTGLALTPEEVQARLQTSNALKAALALVHEAEGQQGVVAIGDGEGAAKGKTGRSSTARTQLMNEARLRRISQMSASQLVVHHDSFIRARRTAPEFVVARRQASAEYSMIRSKLQLALVHKRQDRKSKLQLDGKSHATGTADTIRSMWRRGE